MAALDEHQLGRFLRHLHRDGPVPPAMPAAARPRRSLLVPRVLFLPYGRLGCVRIRRVFPDVKPRPSGAADTRNGLVSATTTTMRRARDDALKLPSPPSEDFSQQTLVPRSGARNRRAHISAGTTKHLFGRDGAEIYQQASAASTSRAIRITLRALPDQNERGSPSCSAIVLRAISLVIGPICHSRASRQYRCMSVSAE